MRRSLTAFAILVAVAGCAEATTGGEDDDATGRGDPFAGATLYANNCAQCHGAELQGTDLGPPHLDRVYESGHHADISFRLAVERGAPQHHWNFGPMPPIDGLTDAEVGDIIAYVREQQRAAGIE
jgi:mono/diheme cytochrome c family protein